MPSKGVSIIHTLRKGFLGKIWGTISETGWDQCTQLILHSCMEITKSQKFLSLVNFSIARFCGIFEDLIKSEILYDLEKDFPKIIFKRLRLIVTYFLCWKGILKQKRILEKIYTARIKRKVFENLLSLCGWSRVQKVVHIDFIFLVSFSLSNWISQKII